jgi:hypothetical protein
MIPKFICVYLDIQKVSAEVGAIINVSHYGDILFRKQKLKHYHQSIYHAAKVDDFAYVGDESELTKILQEIKYCKHPYVILHHSAFAITQPDDFQIFLEKIKHLDTTLSIADFDTNKPFLVLRPDMALGVLDKIAKQPQLTLHVLENEVEVAEKFKLETFYKTIESSVDFIDFLHANFEARHFNSIEKDELYITKRSTKKEKIEHEYRYYGFLPDDLKAFFIQPIDLRKEAEWASYKLEKINVPDVAIQWVHHSFSPKEFKNLLEKLFVFLQKRPSKPLSREESASVVEKFYVQKVAERIEELKSKSEYATIADIIKNSVHYGSIDALFELYKTKLKAVLDKKKYHASLALSHGDLCASNMLYDKRINLLKLIDPRGSSTQEGLFFDSYYDVCKLSHSVMGEYDFINNGLFELIYDPQLKLALKIESGQDRKVFQDAFVKLLEDKGYDYDLVRIFEASLFLSMLPLHIDNPKKVLAFILNAIHILHHIQVK